MCNAVVELFSKLQEMVRMKDLCVKEMTSQIWVRPTYFSNLTS